MPDEQPRSKGRNTDMEQAQRWGFWIGTKASPRRAVKMVPERHEDGRESRRGRIWVEVLEHGSRREPERFYGADVEIIGPHEWLTYYPAVNEPVCGWREIRDAGDGPKEWYCPRRREVTEGAFQPFCRRHEYEAGLQSPEGEESHDHSDEPGADAGGE